MSRKSSLHRPNMDDEFGVSFCFNDETTRSLEEITTPESKTLSKRGTRQLSFTRVDEPRKQPTPLEEAQQRQGGDTNSPFNTWSSERSHKRPRTSYGRTSQERRSATTSIGQSQSTVAAAVRQKISHDLRQMNFIDVDGESSLETLCSSPTKTKLSAQQNESAAIHVKITDPLKHSVSEAPQTKAPRDAKGIFHKDTVKSRTDDTVTSVLANISQEAFVWKPDTKRPAFPGLPAANSATLKKTRIPVGVKENSKGTYQPLSLQSFRLSKVNGSISRRTKATPITIGSSFQKPTMHSIKMQQNHENPLVNTSNEENSKRKSASRHVLCEKNLKNENISQPTPVKEFAFGLARLFIGSLSSSLNCKVTVKDQTETLTISYSMKKDSLAKEHQIRFEDVEEFKCAHHDISTSNNVAEELRILIMRIRPTSNNGLEKLSNSYLQDSTKDVPAKKYIVLDIRNKEEFGKAIHQLKQVEFFKAFFNAENKLHRDDLEKYGYSLLESVKADTENCHASIDSPQSNCTRGKRRKQSSELDKEVLLVFPFRGDDDLIDNAGRGLREASIGCDESYVVEGHTNGKDDETSDEAETTSSRAHFLTIRRQDLDRLQGDDFLNDTLIDFWMQWIRRKEHPVDSPVHIFTSHFYTTLAEGGPKAVESWTAKKNIDIFRKKMIFIPINKNLHWSLCVVVNPGEIGRDRGLVPNDNDPLPCILFLDSLRAHRKDAVAKKVSNWLNSEWKRLDMKISSSSLLSEPFDANTMKIFAPKIPYQNNSWDCGVFVCKYAYGLLKNSDNLYIVKDGDDNFKEAITKDSEFQFTMRDIVRIRKELGFLINKLSILYRCWKREEREKLHDGNADSHDFKDCFSAMRIKEAHGDGSTYV